MMTNSILIPFLFFMSSFIVSWMTTCAVIAEASSSSKNNNIILACQLTPYRAACDESLSTFAPTTPPTDLFARSLQFTIDKAHSARALAYNLSLLSHRATSHDTHINIHVNNVAIIDCLELLDDTLDLLSNTVITTKLDHRYHSTNIQTWLSAALTNQETCLDSLQKYESKPEKGVMKVVTQNLSHFITNSLFLFMHDETNKEKGVPRGGGSRRLLSDNGGSGFPEWVSVSERKLLEASKEEIIGANAVVAKDGSGTHKTIREALEEVKMMGEGRSVIHVKAGTYNENLKIPTKQKNVMLVGDGKGKTVIVGNWNSKDGWTTFQSATVGKMDPTSLQ